MTFLDLGDNIGYFSVIAAGLVKDNGQVQTFEPMPENLTRLRKNLAPFPWAMAQPYAVGNVTEEVPIYYSDKEAGWASIHDQHGLGNLPCNSTVSVIRLDDWLQRNSVNRLDFIRLDIEGSELDALLGARRMLCHFHPTIVAETKFGWNHDEILNCWTPQAINVVHFTEIPYWVCRGLNGLAFTIMTSWSWSSRVP